MDPLSKPRHRLSQDHRPENAFETVLRAAAVADEEMEAAEVQQQQQPSPSVQSPREQLLRTNEKSPQTKKHNFEQDRMNTVNKTREVDRERKPDNEWSMNKANIPGKDKVSNSVNILIVNYFKI